MPRPQDDAPNVERIRFRKIGPNRYEFHVNGHGPPLVATHYGMRTIIENHGAQFIRVSKKGWYCYVVPRWHRGVSKVCIGCGLPFLAFRKDHEYCENDCAGRFRRYRWKAAQLAQSAQCAQPDRPDS